MAGNGPLQIAPSKKEDLPTFLGKSQKFGNPLHHALERSTKKCVEISTVVGLKPLANDLDIFKAESADHLHEENGALSVLLDQDHFDVRPRHSQWYPWESPSRSHIGDPPNRREQEFSDI